MMRILRNLIRGVLGFLLVFGGGPTSAATFTVTTHEDTVGNLGYALSLREAILSTNETPGPNTIVISSEIDQNIVLGGEPLIITNEVEIDGTATIRPGKGSKSTNEKLLPGPIQVSGNNLSRVFIISGGIGPVTIRDMIIADGKATNSDGGGILIGPDTPVRLQNVIVQNCQSEKDGAGIFSHRGMVTLTNCKIRNNVSGYSSFNVDFVGNGGGIASKGGTLQIIDSEIENNQSARSGGGISLVEGAEATLTNVTVTDCFTMSHGGGISTVLSVLVLMQCTILENKAGVKSGNTIYVGRGGGVTVDGGKASIDDCHIDRNEAFMGQGGGLNVEGDATVILTDTVIRENASGSGGGVTKDPYSILSATEVNIVSNSAHFGGGGCYLRSGYSIPSPSSKFTITQGNITGNRATYGGGFFNEGDLEIYSSTISNNTSEVHGAGIFSELGTSKLVNSTISGNRNMRGDGGGIFVWRDAVFDLIHATITNNHADNLGGGIYTSGATVRMGNSILAGNTATVNSPDFFGTLTSLDYNLIGDPTNGSIVGPISHTMMGVDPLLGPLANNGGPTLTHTLLFGSPAIDAASSGLTMDERLWFDQRDFSRIADIDSVPHEDDGVDIGAVEIIALDIRDEVELESSGVLEFTVTLSHAPPTREEVTIQFSTASVMGGAEATDDYIPITGGFLSFSSTSSLSKTILVELVDDDHPEPNESFQVFLSNAYGATIFHGTAVGTIIDNDSPPTPTHTPTPTYTPTNTFGSTHTETPTTKPSPTPHFDYDFDGNGVVDARDLTTLLEVLPILQKADTFDFAHFWMEGKDE